MFAATNGTMQGAHSGAGAAPIWRRVEEGLFWAFVLLVADAPIWLGSNRPFAWYVNAAGTGCLMIAVLAVLLMSGQGRRLWIAGEKLRAPVLCFSLVVAWILIQMVPGIYGEAASPWWPLAGEALGRELPDRITLAPTLTFIALGRLLTDAGVFWLAFQLCRDRDRARLLLIAVFATGCLVAAYALFDLAAGYADVLWIAKTAYRNDATGTFIVRNVFALYSGIAAFAGFELFWQAIRARRIWTAGLLATGLLVLLAAIVLSHSRAASAIVLFCLFVMGLVRAATLAKSRAVLLYNLALGLGLLGAATLVAVSVLESRLLRLDDDWEGRLAIYRLVWGAIQTRPLAGFGYGTFELMFPAFRDMSGWSSTSWVYAHNSYLETLAGLGIPAGALLWAAILTPCFRCAGAILKPNRDLGAARVAVATFLALGLHSFVDFSIQIQGVSITALALLGAGYARAS